MFLLTKKEELVKKIPGSHTTPGIIIILYVYSGYLDILRFLSNNMTLAMPAADTANIEVHRAILLLSPVLGVSSFFH